MVDDLFLEVLDEMITLENSSLQDLMKKLNFQLLL